MNRKFFIIALVLFLVVFGLSANNLDRSAKGDMSIGLELGSNESVSFRYQFADKLSTTVGLGYRAWYDSSIGLFGQVDYIVLDPTYFTKENKDWWFLLTVGGRLYTGYNFWGGFTFSLTVPVTFIVQTRLAPVEFGLMLGPGYQGNYWGGSYWGYSGYSSFFALDSSVFVRYRLN